MPVQKFRTFQEARRALWSSRMDAAYLVRLRGLWALSDRIHPTVYPAGVLRYKDVAAAYQDRQRWIAARVDEIRRKRVKGSTTS